MTCNDTMNLCGILCIDKPEDYTSFDVVARMRGICRTKKIGHAGTLDPMATGVLPLFLGRATKACAILPDQNKRYRASFRLGITTDTQDITGKVLKERPVTASAQEVREALQGFVGDILQLPPMYSAVQVGGQRLYDLARQGIEVEREPREVSILSIDLLEESPETGEYTIDVLCAKGTYIRTLCHDLGEKLGCGAALTKLRRTMAAGFTEADCITLEQAEELLANAGAPGGLHPLHRPVGGEPGDGGVCHRRPLRQRDLHPHPLPRFGGEAGLCATLTKLRRTMAAGFTEADCITLEQAEELLADRELASRVLPVEKAFASLYRVDLSEKQAKMYQNGVKLDPKKTRCSHVEGDIAVYGPGGIFLGVSAVNRETGLLETKSLFALA